MEFITRGHTGPVTEFEIYGVDTINWSVFCRGEIPKKQNQEQIKLKIEIERVGHKTLKLDVDSTLVPRRKLPTGEMVRFY